MTRDGPSATLLVAALAAYGGVLLAIGWYGARRVRDRADFFVAGRRIGPWVLGLSTMSTAFSGFVFLGGPGLTYRLGIASLWISLPLGFTAGLLCWVAGGALHRLAGEREVFTVPDVLAARFGHRGATALSALAVLAGAIAYLGLQIQALGVLGTEMLGLGSPLPATAIGLAAVVAYSASGGMVSGVLTDLFQGAWMLVVALLLGVGALVVAGGPVRIGETLAAAGEFGERFVDPRVGTPGMLLLGFFLVFGVGVLGQPQMLQRFLMLRDGRALRTLPLILGGSQAICLLIWFGIGLAVPTLVATGGMEPPAFADAAATAYLGQVVHPVLAALAVVGILAAIMSTADTFLHLAASAVVRDLPRALGRPAADELRAVRLATPLVAVVAAWFASAFGDLIAVLGTFAFGTFAAALAPTVAIGLHWRRVDGRSATASIATGLVVHLGLEALGRQTAWPALVPPLAPGVQTAALALAASTVTLIVFTARRRP